MIALARLPTGVPAATAARSMSPVESCDDAVLRDQPLRLRALARAGRPEQDQPHRVRPLSFDFLTRPFILVGEQMALDLRTVSMVTLTTISSDVPPK